MCMKSVLLIILFSINAILKMNGQPKAAYTERYFSNISLPSFSFAKEIGKNKANGNYIRAIYSKKRLVKFYAYYHGYIITDTVIYANGVPFYVERHLPPRARKGVNVYAIRWHMHDTLFTYWVKFTNNHSLFTVTDLMYNDSLIIRYHCAGRKFKSIFELVKDLGKNRLEYKSNQWEEITFFVKNQVLNSKSNYNSDSQNGIKSVAEIAGVSSPFKGEYAYFGMLMYFYFNYNGIDPFVGSYIESNW
jgi:hypothetical protein